MPFHQNSSMKKFLQKKNIGLKPLRNKPPKSPLPQTVAAIASLVITTGGILISLIETEIRCSFHLQSESCQGSIINQAEDFYREGSKLLELERNRDALNSFEQAIDLDPKQAQAKVWNKHGVASEKLGKNQQALASYEKALLIDPTYELARQNREELLLKQKQLRSQINQRE